MGELLGSSSEIEASTSVVEVELGVACWRAEASGDFSRVLKDVIWDDRTHDLSGWEADVPAVLSVD